MFLSYHHHVIGKGYTPASDGRSRGGEACPPLEDPHHLGDSRLSRNPGCTTMRRLESRGGADRVSAEMPDPARAPVPPLRMGTYPRGASQVDRAAPAGGCKCDRDPADHERIPTQSYDDNGEPGEDERWAPFYDFQKWLRDSFPLAYVSHAFNAEYSHEKGNVEYINTLGIVATFEGSDSKLKPLVL